MRVRARRRGGGGKEWRKKKRQTNERANNGNDRRADWREDGGARSLTSPSSFPYAYTAHIFSLAPQPTNHSDCSGRASSLTSLLQISILPHSPPPDISSPSLSWISLLPPSLPS